MVRHFAYLVDHLIKRTKLDTLDPTPLPLQPILDDLHLHPLSLRPSTSTQEADQLLLPELEKSLNFNLDSVRQMSDSELKEELKRRDQSTTGSPSTLRQRLIEVTGLNRVFLCPFEGCNVSSEERPKMERHIMDRHLPYADKDAEEAELPPPNPSSLVFHVPPNPASPPPIVSIVTAKPDAIKTPSLDQSVLVTPANLPGHDEHLCKKVSLLPVNVLTPVPKEKSQSVTLQRKRNAVARKIYKQLGSTEGSHAFEIVHPFRQLHAFDEVFDVGLSTHRECDGKLIKIKQYDSREAYMLQFGKDWLEKSFSIRYGSEYVHSELEFPLIIECDEEEQQLVIHGRFFAHERQKRSFFRPVLTRPQPPEPSYTDGSWKHHVVKLW